MLEAERLDGFAAAFATLGSLHRQAPDQASLEAIGELLDEWPVPNDPASQAGLAHWRQSRELAESADSITADHARLYGVAAKGVVSPYESVHRNTEGLVFDEATLEVRHAYRALGLQAPRLNREPDDHLGLEFDFLAQALLRELADSDAGRAEAAAQVAAVAREFLITHLMAWAPAVLRTVAEHADTHFMKGLAELSLGTLESYRSALGA